MRKDRKRTEAEQRQREQPLRRKVKELEARLESLTRRRAEIDAQLAGSDLYAGTSKDKLKELLRDQARVKSEIDEVEEAWLDASEACRGPFERTIGASARSIELRFARRSRTR